VVRFVNSTTQGSQICKNKPLRKLYNIKFKYKTQVSQNMNKNIKENNNNS